MSRPTDQDLEVSVAGIVPLWSPSRSPLVFRGEFSFYGIRHCDVLTTRLPSGIDAPIREASRRRVSSARVESISEGSEGESGLCYDRYFIDSLCFNRSKRKQS